MEDEVSLPTKRAIVEIASDSSDEAQKKAKMDLVFDFSRFTSVVDFCVFYEHSPVDPLDVWRKYEKDLREKFKLQEIEIFLKSRGKEDDANKIQSLNDDLACTIEDSLEFNTKGWILRPDPGSYTEYQRLYVGKMITRDETGELDGKYSRLFCTYASDREVQKLFEELQDLLKWDTNSQDAMIIGENVFNKYNDLEPEILGCAIQEILFLKKIEEERKEVVPFFTKLWQEIVNNGRNADDVLTEIKNNDAALYEYPFFVRSIDILSRRKSDAPFVGTIEEIKSFINGAQKEEDLSMNDEELIHKFFYPPGRRLHVPGTYASYVNKKMIVAENLGLI